MLDRLKLASLKMEKSGNEKMYQFGEKIAKSIDDRTAKSASFEVDGNGLLISKQGGTDFQSWVNKHHTESNKIIDDKIKGVEASLASKGTGETVKKIGDINDPIRTYRGADLGKLEAKYTADPRLTVEMPYVGKGQKNTNAEGWLRDKDFYWKEMLEKYPEAFNRSNRQKIELGFAPINNPTFRKHFPQYDLKELYNDTLIHHHIGGGGQAVAVPSKLHPGLGGIHNAEKSAGVWGNDQKYAELLEKFLEK